MEVTIGPPSPAAPFRPRPQFAIRHDVAIAFRESQVRLGAGLIGHVARQQPHGCLVDCSAGEANAGFLLLGGIGHARRRLIDQAARGVAVLRADGRGNDETA
jgi:hypothetical protein